MSKGSTISNAKEHRFVFLLSALTLLFVAAPIVRELGPGLHPRLADGVVAAAFATIILSVVFAVSRSRLTELVALGLAIPAIGLQALHVWRGSQWVAVADHCVGIVFLTYAVVLVLRYLFDTSHVTLDMICASVCVYFILAVIWAMGYSLLQAFDPQSFSFSYASEKENEVIQFGGARTMTALYYSFVTMSTLGYGDIVPRSPLARMAAALQAVVGQLYLVVLVSRLVGIHISQSTSNKHDRSQDG